MEIGTCSKCGRKGALVLGGTLIFDRDRCSCRSCVKRALMVQDRRMVIQLLDSIHRSSGTLYLQNIDDSAFWGCVRTELERIERDIESLYTYMLNREI